MSHTRFAILDPAAGISGDMLLGALIGAGAPVAWLEGVPARLGLEGVRVSVRRTSRCGIAAVKVDVAVHGEVEHPNVIAEAPAGAAAHPHHEQHQHAHDHDHRHGEHHAHPAGHEQAHAHGHAHGGAHRHVRELLAIVSGAPLSDWVKARALAAIRLLGEAEGRIHGVPAEEVALHEVGALDALVDIVGGIEGFEQLGITRITTRPVALGSGWIRCAHGTLPVPAPATALLVEGLEIGPNGPVTGEATTPTGAALLRVLAEGPPPARWRALGASWGAGGRDPQGYPNALRLLLAQPAAEAAEIVTLSCDVDDLSPEYLEPLREALAAAGAVDVQVWSTQMKKGRTGFRIEALAAPGEADAVADAMLRHSTTAGLRRSTAERVTLARQEIAVDMGAGDRVRVKVLDAPGGLRAKPEYEDVAAVARRTGRPAHEVARLSQSKALAALERIP